MVCTLKHRNGVVVPPAARMTDISLNPADVHGCNGCPHGVQGPALSGSSNTIVAGQALLRARGADNGVHAGCCGPNIWVTMQGSTKVYCNDLPVVRVGDATTHCGGVGSIITGATQVIIGG